jgi:hypothetical protein
MKTRSLFVGVIIALLLLFALNVKNKQALASDQKLAHGAGTLPHLTNAITLSLGAQEPTPYGYSLRYDIGLGKRVQLGLSTMYFSRSSFSVEIHSMFNALQTDSDSNFISLYFNPSITRRRVGTDYWYYYGAPYTNYCYSCLNTGVTYEHRFGSKRRIGLYMKAGVFVLREYEAEQLIAGYDNFMIDSRIGFQALLGKRFSIAIEPELLFRVYDPWPFFKGKVALTWAF